MLGTVTHHRLPNLKAPPLAATATLSLVERQNALLASKGFTSPSPTKQESKPESSKPESKQGSEGSQQHPRKAPAPRAPRAGMSKGFQDRSDAHLVRHGRSNAARASRVAAPMDDGGGNGGDGGGGGGAAHDDSASTASMLSLAPSLHPSMAASSVSIACSEKTIGAGDEVGWMRQAETLTHGPK